MKINFNILNFFKNLVKTYPVYSFDIEGKNKEKVSKLLDERDIIYEVYFCKEIKEGYTFKMSGKYINEKDFQALLIKMKNSKIKYFI